MTSSFDYYSANSPGNIAVHTGSQEMSKIRRDDEDKRPRKESHKKDGRVQRL